LAKFTSYEALLITQPPYASSLLGPNTLVGTLFSRNNKRMFPLIVRDYL